MTAPAPIATDATAPYTRAMQRLAPEDEVRMRLVVEEVRAGWAGGMRLHEIADKTGLHRKQVMVVVHQLGLPDRCPCTCLTLPPLPPELQSH